MNNEQMSNTQTNNVMENTMKKFEIGKRYGMNSLCDCECWWYYTVVSRTACMVTLESESGEIINCRINKKISEWNRAESVFPLGRFSMCPTLTADKIVN